MKSARVACAGALHSAVPHERGLRLADGRVLAEEAVVWLPPFEVGTVIALGLNYADHVKERARDLTKLLVPYEPTEGVVGFAEYKARHPQSLISQLHVFPLGGIKTAAEWMNRHAQAEAGTAFA